MIKNISIIGGDLRIVKLERLLRKDNYEVHTYALEKADVENKCETLEETIRKSDIIIGGVPFSSNKIDVNTPFSDVELTVEKLLSTLRGKLFIARKY